MDDRNADPSVPRYRWPWFVLAALILGTVLTVIWMAVAVRRVREQRISDPFAGSRTAGSHSAK